MQFLFSVFYNPTVMFIVDSKCKMDSKCYLLLLIYLILQYFTVNPKLRRTTRSSLAEPRVSTVTFHRVTSKENVDGSFQRCLGFPTRWIARRNFSFRRVNRTRKAPTWSRYTWCLSRYVPLESLGWKKGTWAFSSFFRRSDISSK